MKIRIFIDATVPVDARLMVDGLRRVMPSISWSVGVSPFATRESFISAPDTYAKLSARFRREIEGDDLALLFTEKPYDNNYFFESGDEKASIVSLFGWEHLTNLPRANGVAYFTAALLVRRLGIGESHRIQNTGCINDFWQDKTGVDSGMRAAYICAACTSKKMRGTAGSAAIRNEISALLDDISSASRATADLIEYWADAQTPAGSAKFQVFLCHNSKDKAAVRRVNRALQDKNVSTWLDEEQLPPGRAWQALLEEQIQTISSVAVFVGESGFGPWQDVEMRAFITEFVRRRCPVIPVILEDCVNVPQLPLFMQQFTWVDFRKKEPPPTDMLVWGITGVKPEPKIAVPAPSKRAVRRKRGQ